MKRKKEKMRLHRALDKRSADLIQMLNAFPPNFLPQDLQIFLFRCIVDVFEQLSKLAPEKEEYLEQFKVYTTHMESALRAPKNNAEVNLQSSAQINEIRQYLNYLGRFMQRWMQRGNLSTKQYSGYKELLKNLIAKLMVDNYVLSAKQAVQIEKHKLAVHYYMLAKNILTKEGLAAGNKGRLTFINEELSTLEKRVKEEEQAEAKNTASENGEQEQEGEDAKAWQKYSEDEDWKKKNVYD